jgi:hypothetical protein
MYTPLQNQVFIKVRALLKGWPGAEVSLVGTHKSEVMRAMIIAHAVWHLAPTRRVGVILSKDGNVQVRYEDNTAGKTSLMLTARGWQRCVEWNDASTYWEFGKEPAYSVDVLLRGFFALIAAGEALQPEPLATLWHDPKAKRDASPVRK